MEVGFTDPFDPRRTNFDALRIFAALIVLYGNGWVLTGGPGRGLWGAPFARIGIDLLFAISGYLAAGSWDRKPRLGAFLAKRVLRVFPGLIACVLATILVAGPLATHLPLRWYVLNKLTIKYLANIALYLQLWLPGVFQGQQWNGAVNPMLWTLFPGLLCIVAVPALARLRWPYSAWILLAAAVLCAGASLFLPEGYEQRFPAHLGHVLGREVLIEIPFFLAGALLLWLEKHGRNLWRADLAMLCFAANWIAATWINGWDVIVEWVTLPYMAVCFGRMSAPLLGQAGRLGNPSYGLYLYAFPIQQLIVARMPGDPHPILTCAAITLPVAFLSWHLVERPALRWAGPGGALRRWAGRASLRAAS